MSFGFGIGDIVLCTKIAYRIYSTLTDGRINAPKDLKELNNAIFGLYCALGHLQREYSTILDSAVSRSGNNAAQVKQQLAYMILACRTTLEELDTATAKYRDAAGGGQPNVNLPAIQGSSNSMSLPRHFKAQAKVQLRRMAWDLRGDSLSKYRGKLQSHTDALNLLLNSLIWSITARIEESTADHARKMSQLVQEASQFSLNFSQLMQQIQANQSQTPALPLPPASSSYVNVANFLQIDQTRAVDQLPVVHADTAPVIGSAVNTISAHFALVEPRPEELVPQTQPPSQPSKRSQTPSQPSKWPPGLNIQLPQKIHVLNESRQVVGEREFRARTKALGVDSTIPPKSPTKPQVGKKVQNLTRVLEGIFNALNTSPSTRITTNEQLWNDIVDWVDKLDALSNTLSSRSPLDKELKEERNRTINDTVKLLVTLNRLHEKATPETRGIFYEASSMKVDCTFIKLKRLSTHCAKEIEEFEDEREDWKDR